MKRSIEIVTSIPCSVRLPCLPKAFSKVPKDLKSIRSGRGLGAIGPPMFAAFAILKKAVPNCVVGIRTRYEVDYEYSHSTMLTVGRD